MLTADLRDSRTTLSDLAYRQILAAILSHELKPGQRLSPEELASGMRISPTPVKHALARLAGEGLVSQVGGFRTVVASPSDEEIEELNSCRLMCELFAIREGAGNIDGNFLAEADRILDEWDRAARELSDDPNSRRRLGRLDAEFHLHLMSLYPNQKMLDWYRQLDIHLRTKYIIILTSGPRHQEGLDESRREHRAIYEALERRDVEGAAGALRRHITAANASMRELRKGMEEIIRE